MKLLKVFLFATILSGCSYRYGAGYFSLNDPPPSEMPAAYPTTNAPQPVVAAPCENESEEKLVVTNKLDSQNQTIETTAITKRTSNQCGK
jgi:hypothetical protein